MKVSLIVSTYNSPLYLKWALASVSWLDELPDEVIVADDGSDASVTQVIRDHQAFLDCHVVHSWISDSGFRLARSRNCAAKRATGDLLLFLDGDCILAPDYIRQAKKIFKDGMILNGARKLLTKHQTESFLFSDPEISQVRSFFSGRKFWRVNCSLLRDYPIRKWPIFRGFSMGIPREVFIRMSGFDETYRSWGLEDSDFAVRALRDGFRIRDGRYALSVLHMYHPEPPDGTVSENEFMFHNMLRLNKGAYDQG